MLPSWVDSYRIGWKDLKGKCSSLFCLFINNKEKSLLTLALGHENWHAGSHLPKTLAAYDMLLMCLKMFDDSDT